MRMTVILQSPFLDKIPSLKTLIVYLYGQGHTIKVISSVNSLYPISDLSMCPKIKQVLVKERSRRFELPTKIKLLFRSLKDFLLERSDIYIGGDEGGCYILNIFHRIFKMKYVNFLLEYPNINDANQLKMIEDADILITHDHWHSDFLREHCDMGNKKVLYLPNASYTGEYHANSEYLSKHLNIDSNKVIILHSGGLGKWFMCKELAVSARDWSKDKILVFHTSHSVKNAPYYTSMLQAIGGQNNILFSINPVPNEELDELVASAKIGVALYSIQELGYRAEYMGVAAGKIGNYLKCGVPVVVNRLPSLSYIEDFKCGVLIDDVSDIESAFNEILNHYEEFREGAYRCYRELWYPKRYLEVIEEQFYAHLS